MPIKNLLDDNIPLSCSRSGVCYRPEKGESGNILYSYKKGRSILEKKVGLGYDFVNNCDGPVEIVKFSDPTLRLEFGKILKPCTIEVSIADTADRIISYPKITCVPDELTYTIGLVPENTPIDFIFEPVKRSENEEQYFYLSYIGIDPDDFVTDAVPEPISLITMGLGITKLIKKQKCKENLYKNNFDIKSSNILVK